MSWKKHHDKMKKTSGSFHKIFLKFFMSFSTLIFFVGISVKKPDKYNLPGKRIYFFENSRHAQPFRSFSRTFSIPSAWAACTSCAISSV